MAEINHYILEGRIIERVSFMKWVNWFEKKDNRRIKLTKLSNEIDVSTVFLSIDHDFSDNKPILFETMIFGGNRDEECDRYSTLDESLKGHNKIVKEFLEKGFKIIEEDIKFEKEKFTKFSRFEIMDI